MMFNEINAGHEFVSSLRHKLMRVTASRRLVKNKRAHSITGSSKFVK